MNAGIATIDGQLPLRVVSTPELPSHLFKGSERYLHAALSRSSSKARLAYPRDASKTGFLASSISLGTLILLRALQPPSGPDTTGTQTPKTLRRVTPYPRVWNAALQLVLAPEHTATHDGCEVLYGCAGFLYALLRLRSASDQNSSVLTSARPPIDTALQTPRR